MALAGTIKLPTAAMLLALVVAAAAVSPSTGAGDQLVAAGWPAKGGGGRRDGGDSQKQKLFPAGLTACVTICGTQTTTCLLDCYKPAVGGNLVSVPLCLLKCSNDAVVCASRCSSNIV